MKMLSCSLKEVYWRYIILLSLLVLAFSATAQVFADSHDDIYSFQGSYTKSAKIPDKTEYKQNNLTLVAEYLAQQNNTSSENQAIKDELEHTINLIQYNKTVFDDRRGINNSNYYYYGYPYYHPYSQNQYSTDLTHGLGTMLHAGIMSLITKP